MVAGKGGDERLAHPGGCCFVGEMIFVVGYDCRIE